MTAVVGLFYGSDTGNTEKVAKKIQAELGENLVDIYDVAKATKEDLLKYDFLIFGCPTWYTGDLQSDWENFVPVLKEVSLAEKIVAIFGCGNQEDYSEYFVDAMGTIKEIVEELGGTIVGNWSTDGYSFESYKALVDDEHFVGLAIDEDTQYELTDERIKNWCAQLKDEMALNVFEE